MKNPKIIYQINSKNQHQHIFKVRLELHNPNPLGQVFYLPNWIPGSYLIRDFAKHIVSIKATSCDKSIVIKKLDKNHWIAHPCSKNLIIEYEVYAFDSSPRSAFLSSDRAFFNASSVFLTAIGFEHEEVEIHIKPPPKNRKWQVATTLNLAGENRWSADNYNHLIDCPVLLADFLELDWTANKIPHKMAIIGEKKVDIKRLKTDLTKVCEHHLNFFGSTPPFDKYLFLTLATHNDFGGIEHKNCSSLITPKDELPQLKNQKMTTKYMRFLSLCSHEYFHAWWIKTIKPASFFDLDLSRENYTEQLWAFEGITSYYDDFSLLRAGLISHTQYLKLFAKTITRVMRANGRFKQSLTESSFDAWTRFYQQDENSANAIVSYYTKGAVFSFVLDIEIRKITKNQHCLDDVLVKIWQDYQKTGTENNTFQLVIEDLTGADFSQFFNDYLHGTKELPLIEAFDYLGIDCKFTHQKNDLSDFGIRAKKHGKFAKIIEVFDGTGAQKSGLYVGDKIKSINKNTIKPKDLAKKIATFNEADEIIMEVLRDEITHKIKLKIKHQNPTFCTLKTHKNPNKTTKTNHQNWCYPPNRVGAGD